MSVKIAINGFGRIGRCAARIILERDDCELVAINDTAKREMTRYLLKFDTVHGEFKHDVKVVSDDCIEVDGKKIKVYSTRDANELDFAGCGADVVLECTGANLTSEKCEPFIKNGIKKVVMSAPAKDDTPTYVIGVNTDDYKNEAIISNASCTTNCLAPVVKILDSAFGIQKGLMTTIHAYTHGQSILDVKGKDFRRSRAAAANMIPTTTGAAKAIGKVMPHLLGKMHGQSIRVPMPNVSLVDLTVVLGKQTTVEEVNEAFKKASLNEFKNLIKIDDEYRVSSDFMSDPASSIFVPDTTQVICGDMVKVLAWYDNEWGYSARLVDMGVFVGKRG
ncbi:type I glyceraldehyde-3-phosphate dehydrogenase [Campylobacter sp. RM9344]|uniref:Glyceraldehyde-3-phosphate dehydrogenase n=1 Tax=Campylobacter californiensis TaxID=1032243 RepID=A0AAW3ZQP8_9BACT|nr:MULTISPECIES: type I glyceraldehyde-3-phosphate dehydrogenase [unclassified Campylobacter]MBE2984438.1 type I glyceraldehyde-3-phosphate dehydrogenase [Campylobacter sp. RM6883]MBE2985776.1 type I glyceraldehyde-3-phosphate dehydrogenase [Campylobacter sp. RM12919]MBE2987891.1 type I glyceraldehyde-3-phosphate dehydrogenase [Campylobacter sp. RM12920]MBE2995032.1 type I glyceraldehyde-3-phosphate dehydrogenase [Campylobacter sp. RM6913]MBE3028877.1 type I glyceraldehyde-3-phosphate dehydrog